MASDSGNARVRLARESAVRLDGPSVESLVYPGHDKYGRLWEKPPDDECHVPEEFPGDRPRFTAVLGSSGFRASWQAGVAHVLEEVGRPMRVDVASGGTVPGLAMAAGIHRRWRRIMNAGAPTHQALRSAEGLRWFERRNLDLAGVYDLSGMERWLARWLAWAGVSTFRDLRYAPDETGPRGVRHRVGISVVMWRTATPYPELCSRRTLADPEFVHKAFRWAFYGRNFPLKRFRQVWVPDTVPAQLPWLAEEIEDHSPALWARVSMSQWPACLPFVLQDPKTRHLVFLADGGHIDNQPSLFNDGAPPDLPLVNPRLMQNSRQSNPGQARRDARRMPFGRVIRFPVTEATAVSLMQGHSLTWRDRDRMWRQGVLQGRAILPGIFAALPGDYADMRRRAEILGRHRSVEVPAFHGFQAIAAEERPGRRPRLGLRS